MQFTSLSLGSPVRCGGSPCMTSKVPDVSRVQGKSLCEAEDKKRTGRERRMGDGVWPPTNVPPLSQVFK